MKVLVTGSSGFIGRYLVEKLLELGHTVVGCDLKSSDFANRNYHSHETDFTSQQELGALFSKREPGYCFHVGAVADVNYARQHSIETVKANVFGTGVVAEMCRRFDCFLTYVSTCCVYGDTDVFPTHEDALLRPTEIYGSTKLAGEYVVKGYRQLYGLDCNILRYSTVYGPRMREALAPFIFLSRAIRNETLQAHGDGAHTRSYIFVEDLVDATVKAMEVKDEVVNIAGEESVSTLELAELCWRMANPNEKVALEFIPDRPGNVKKEHIDITKAKRILNWSPKTSIEEGLEMTYDWMRGVLKRS